MQPTRSELERLYDEHRRGMFACAVAVTRCRDLAEDAVHEAFCRLLCLEQTPQDLKAYAFRSVRNAAVDLVRRTARNVPLLPDAFFDQSDGPRESAEKREFQLRVTEALRSLSENERETIVQHLYADLTFREIAGLRGLPLATVASWYRRGMDRLKGLLKDQLEE
jgi:RNA polymerase sigma-70 factor (ECF subfamily)